MCWQLCSGCQPSRTWAVKLGIWFGGIRPSASAGTVQTFTTNTVYQSGTFTNYTGPVQLLNTPGAATLGSPGTNFSPVGTMVSGLVTWSNTGTPWCVVSNLYNNGTSNCWAVVSNADVYYFSKALDVTLHPVGTPLGTWNSLLGSVAKPSINWYVNSTNNFNPQTVLVGSYPIVLSNSVRVIQVETWGLIRMVCLEYFRSKHGRALCHSNTATQFTWGTACSPRHRSSFCRYTASRLLSAKARSDNHWRCRCQHQQFRDQRLVLCG